MSLPIPKWIEEASKDVGANRWTDALIIAWQALAWVENDAKGLAEAEDECRSAMKRIEALGDSK